MASFAKAPGAAFPLSTTQRHTARMRKQHQTQDGQESCTAAKRFLLNMLPLRMLVTGRLEQLRLFLFEGAPRRMQLRDS